MMHLFFAKLHTLPFFAAEGDPCNPGGGFFFLPPWWKYLGGVVDSTGQCTVNFSFTAGDIGAIGIAILEILLRLAGFLAVVSIIISGIELVVSEGSPEKAVAARNRLVNSLVGLAIAAGAVAVVAFLGARLGGQQTGSGIPQVAANQGMLDNIFNIVFVIFGAVAFLIMVVAGLRLILSRGEPNKIADARRQIIYGALGLIVIAIAAAIVNFVLNRL